MLIFVLCLPEINELPNQNKKNCPEIWSGLQRKAAKSLQDLCTHLTCKILIELKARQFYSISLTLRFFHITTQLSLSLFLEFVFDKGGLNTFTTHQTIA